VLDNSPRSVSRISSYGLLGVFASGQSRDWWLATMLGHRLTRARETRVRSAYPQRQVDQNAGRGGLGRSAPRRRRQAPGDFSVESLASICSRTVGSSESQPVVALSGAAVRRPPVPGDTGSEKASVASPSEPFRDAIAVCLGLKDGLGEGDA
jgi:hypothetical protein